MHRNCGNKMISSKLNPTFAASEIYPDSAKYAFTQILRHKV